MKLAFLDTNVLVYLFDADNPAKQSKAQALFDELSAAGRLLVSTQVLQEFYVVATRKLALPLTSHEAEQVVRDLAVFTVVPIDAQVILSAIQAGRRYDFSLWDSLIIQAALRGGAEVLYSEDLQHGQIIDGMTIRNPFNLVSHS